MASSAAAASSTRSVRLQMPQGWHRLRDRVEAWLHAERDRIALWVPVAFGAGAGGWFLMPDPNQWIAAMLAALAIACAAAAIGPLAFVLGNLAKGGAAVAGAFSWLLPAGTGAAAAAAARTPAGAALLAGVPAYLAYSDVSGQAGRMGDYQSRMMRGGFIPSDRDFAPDKFERLTVESIQAAVRGDRSIEGRVQVDVTTKVEPSPDFISRAISSVKSLWSGGITGTTGSTGTSMPEAMPGGVP